MALTIDKNLCPQNHKCPMLVICPVQAITQQGNALPVIDVQLCVECGKCIKVCGRNAVYKQN